MRTLATIVMALAVLTAGPVLGAEKAEVAPGSSVEMPFLIAPLSNAQGRLTAYAYISSKIIASSPDSAVHVREQTPFIQDAFVRDVNGRNIGGDADPTTIDKAALAARLIADARRIMGPGKVVSLDIIQIQISPLRAAPPQG